VSGVERSAFEAPAEASGLRMSSLAILQAGEALSPEQTAPDNPLEYLGARLVPAARPRFVVGGLQRLRFYVVLYPDPASPEPPALTLELHRDGQRVARGEIALPAHSGSGPLPYLGSFDLSKRSEGVWELRLVARQGAASAQESAEFEMTAPRRVGIP
jgi:hypothetical protein